VEGPTSATDLEGGFMRGRVLNPSLLSALRLAGLGLGVWTSELECRRDIATGLTGRVAA
jgi:hypothetical protein